MLTMERIQDTDMRDLERELVDSIACRQTQDGEPLAGKSLQDKPDYACSARANGLLCP